MARNFPADSKLQHFFEEQFDKETTARLQFHADVQSGRIRRSAAEESASRALKSGLPQINPFEFAVRQKREEDEALREIVAEAKARRETEEMRAVDGQSKELLYSGFSHEGRGRAQYLRERHQHGPDAKYTYPVLSSWEYGWKVDDEMGEYGRPRHARTSKIKDSFYTRNGVPTISSPAEPPCAVHTVD